MEDSQEPEGDGQKPKRKLETLGLDLSLLIHNLRMGFTFIVKHEERNGRKSHRSTWLYLFALLAIVGSLALLTLWSLGMLGLSK